MERVGYSFSIKAKLKLTRSDVEFLCELGRNHYDATCRMAATPCPNGFLQGARVQFMCVEADTIIEEWSFRECDIARKILESARYLDSATQLAASALDSVLHSAQIGINAETAHLNK
jgi:hypothetical protein